MTRHCDGTIQWQPEPERLSPLSGHQLRVVVIIIIVPLRLARAPVILRQAGLLSTPVASVLQEARSAHAQRHSGTASVPQRPTARVAQSPAEPEARPGHSLSGSAALAGLAPAGTLADTATHHLHPHLTIPRRFRFTIEG